MRSAALRAQLESALGGRWPSPFTFRERPRTETVSSGIAPIDWLTGAGGLPRGALTEIFGPDSSGRTSLLLSLLAQMTAREEACALVDSTDAFDPLSAEAAGVDLRRLLWVRCARAGIRDSGLRLPIADCRLPIENRRLHLLQSAIVNRKSAIPRPEPRTPNPDPERSFVAAGQTDQPGSVLGQLLLGYSTLSFPGAQFHARDQAAEVLIPRARLDQKRIPEALGRGDFGADVGANAGLPRRHVKARGAVDAVAVEERHRRHVQLRAQGGQLLRQRSALEKAEGGPGMEFDVHPFSVISFQLSVPILIANPTAARGASVFTTTEN